MEQRPRVRVRRDRRSFGGNGLGDYSYLYLPVGIAIFRKLGCSIPGPIFQNDNR
jgi:hypothetical protein